MNSDIFTFHDCKCIYAFTVQTPLEQETWLAYLGFYLEPDSLEDSSPCSQNLQEEVS